jgi:transglutaminase-like putative cysteine protease
MKIPPLLIGCAAVFWGIQTGNPVIGFLLFLIIEGRQVVTTRYDFDTEDFVKISDLSSLLLLGSVALVLLNYEATSFLRLTAGWLPLTLSPLIVAQLYSGSNTVTIGTRIGKKKQSHTHKPIDFRMYYILICLFGAASGNNRSPWFFVVTGALIAVLLFYNRGRNSSPLKFIGLLSLCLLSGYAGSFAIEAGHRYAVHKSFRFFYDYYNSQNADPYKSHINFGDTGQLKFSGKIVMRVDSKEPPPTLFREAVYSTYNRGDWFGNQGQYAYVAPVKPQEWNLVELQPKKGQTLTVEFGLPREQGLLPYPYGGYYLSSSTIFRIEQHPNKSVKVVDGAPLILYDISFQSGKYIDDTPDTSHLGIPQNELYVLKEVRNQLFAAGESDAAKVAALKRYFSTGYLYSLEMLGRGRYSTALGNFLLNKKSGFCEYYATATALLLRSMNIPSRYAIGYAVFEKSKLEDKYVVRDRHAHAWAEAYVDGRWVVVDTTPAEWNLADAENASIFEPIWDVFYFLRHKYRLYQIGATRDYTPVFTGVVVVLITFLAIRIYRRMRMEKAAAAAEVHEQRQFERVITPFTPVLDTLIAAQGHPQNDESITQWAKRSGFWSDLNEHEFRQLYDLHLQSRFDTKDMTEEKRTMMERAANRLFAELENQTGLPEKKR